MKLYLFFGVCCCVLFGVAPAEESAGDEPAGDMKGENEVPPAQKWESFKALETENPELAWEKLKLWFKNNGNIQHVEQPWKDFKMFKDSLILEQLKSTEDTSEQDTSEQKIEEAWQEFEKVGEEVGGLSEEEKVDVVLEKFREFYTQVKEDGTQEIGQIVEESEDQVAEVEDEAGGAEGGAEGGGGAEELELEEEPVAEGEEEPVAEGEEEPVAEGEEEPENVDDGEDVTDSTPDGNGEDIVDDVAEDVADVLHFQSSLEEQKEERQKTEDNDLASEIEQKAAAESELVKALSEEMLAKFAELKKENSALKERISSLETGLTDKLDTITSELAALRKQVEEEPEADGNTSGTNLQEVQDLISKSLKLYAADEVGMPDFALESSGAVVFTIGETEPYTRDTPWMGVFGISIWRSCKTPRLAIQKDNSPGNCWSFTGDKGSLTIQLSAQVFPEHFTVDHIPLELAPNGNASSAPYYFRVLGLDYGNAPKGHVLGNYEFTEFPIQTFAVQQNPYEKYFRFVKVEILSNHGNKDYTCLYRFRVHGRPHDTDTYNG